MHPQFSDEFVIYQARLDTELLRRALADYAKYADKAWGLVDCASFLVMQERGITEAFTSDRDFEQAGFSCLLAM